MFDINGARQAGYSENEIADFMAQQRGFNISGAREAGYSDNEILAHLDSLQSTDRSFKEIGLDTVKQLGVGVGSTIEGLGTVGMLLGSDRAKSMKDLGNKITEDLRGSYSQGLKNNISEQQQYINKADGEASKFWRTIESTATNPALLATFIAESAPQMLAGGVVGRGVGSGAKLLGAGEALAGKMAIGGAMGTGSVLQGADSASNTYDTLMKLDDGVWSQNQQFKALVEQGADPLQAKDEISKSLARKTLATSGAISLATQGAFSKIGGNAFERALVGQAEKGTVGGIAGKALAEAGSEAIEEGSGQGASNYNVNQVTPTSLFKNVGQSAGQGAITGFTMGGFGGAVEAFKPMTQLVEEEKAKIQAESGNVNAVNNSFNVFGDLAQRSDAINPNIGDINYNQFTQSVDNTTTTPTNTVNVPNVESLDQEIKRAEFYLRSLIGTGAKEEDIKIAQDRIEELKQKSKQQAQEAPTTEKPKDNRLNISDNSLMNFGELQNSELTQGVFANNDWQILKDKGYIETVRNENGDTYEAVTQEGRQALHNERDTRHLEEMNKSETIDDQISTAEKGVRSVGNRIKYYKDIINDELSTDEQKEIAQKSLNRDEKRLQEAYDKLNNLKKQRDLQKKEAVSKMETTETPQVVKENLTAPTSAENAQVKEPKEVKKPADISEQEFNIIKEVKAVRPYLSNKDIVEAIRSNGKTNTEMKMALGSSKTYKAFKNEQQKAEFKTYKQSKKDSIKFKFDGVTYEADGDTIYTTYKNKRIDNGYKFNPNGKTVFDIFGDNTRMAEAYIQAQGKSTKDFQPDYIAPIQNKIAKAEAMEKQAMQNGDLETAKKVSEAKQGLELQQLQSHPRYQELMDMRKDIASKDTQYSQKLLQPRDIRTVNNGKGNDLEVTGALYTPNYASDFELTKADVKALQSGKATPKIIQKLKSDLGRLDNDPQYQLPIDEQQANDGLLFSKEQQPITKKESISYDGKDIGYIKTTKSGNFVNIDDIQVFKQGTGQGTQAIKNVMAQAEKDGTIVTLTSDAMRGKQNQKKNRELYEKLGFVKNSGANKIKGTKEEFYYKPQQQQAKDGLLFSKENITEHVKDFKSRIAGKKDDIERLIQSYSYGKAKMPSEVYRGISGDDKLINSSSGGASEGYGLYTTLNKSLASDYGKITKLSGSEALPKKPLVFSDYNNYEIFLQQLMHKVAGYKRASDFSQLNPNEIIHAIKPEVDGIQIGKGNKTFWVKFPDINEVRTKQNYDVLESKGKGDSTTADKATQIVNKLLGNSKVRQDVEVVQSFDNLPNDIKKRMELMSIVYHGTPHNVDKFSTKYIGSGEGAQAYGYGLYFADSKEVAEFYRTSTMSRDNRIAYDKAVEEIKNLKSLIEEAQSNPKLTSQLPKLKEFLVKAEKTKQELSQLGNLYRVELKPKEEEYLLWDKPLDEQSLHVKEALQKELDIYRKSEGAKGAYVNNSSGEKLYKEFIYTYGSDKKASERLNELGIKGIKYEDGNSRSRDVNKNHNYVIFNDDDVGTPELLQSADGVVRGIFDPKTNKAYLVADTMAENEVKGVLLHELLHRAINNEVKRQSDKQGQTVSRLDAILGSKLEQVTADLKSLEAKGDKDVLEAVSKAKEAGTPKQHMLEETLAYLLQNQTNKYSTPLKEFLLKVATAIKDFAKRVAVKMGIEPNWLASQITADDIANILKSYALDDGSAKTSGEPMMSKISDRMKRLMEWHKDSAPETKNADGTPKVFYHGSPYDISSFKPSDYDFIYFTETPKYAERYAFGNDRVGGVYPVYIKANKIFDTRKAKDRAIFEKEFYMKYGNGTKLDTKTGLPDWVEAKELKEFFEDNGYSYDGVMLAEHPDNIGNGISLGVVNPAQIKSVNNKGTFDESNPNILFSRTDDVKKLAKQARSKAKQFLSDQLNKTALERSIDMLSKPKDEAYSAFKSLVMNTLPQKYMDALGEMHKSKNRIEQQVGVVKASLSTLSLEQRTQLHDYIVNDVKTIDPELKKLADKISGIITNLGQELINQGILEAHVVKAWEGKFLKRQFKNEEAVLGTSKFKTYFFGSKKSLAKQYTRGLQLQAETEAEAIKAINGYLKAYGHDEISGMGVNEAIKYLKDNGLFADGVQWKSDGKIKVREMKNGEYEIIRDFTKAEREKMEEVTDAGITVPDTILRLSTLLEHGKMLKATTELNDYVTDDKTMGNSMKWTQIENKPQYGVLAGKWVRPDIASDIIANQNAFYERDGLVDTWLKGLSLWKKSRTVWSPTGHFNNFVSNLFIKHGLGLDPFKNTLEAGKMLSQLQEYEALEVKDAMGTLTAEEKTKFKTMKSYLSSAIELRDNGMLGHTQLLDINRGFEQDGITEEKGALGKLDDAVSKLYQGGDTIHRLSSYMLIKEAGYDSETAMLVVDKLFPDYSKPMPKVWRWARDTGISPFISWTYYTLPAIAKITMANPVRTLGAYSALGAIGFLGMLLGSDGDWEEAIQSFLNLPEDAIGRRMPIWKNDKGEVLTWKVDRLMPFMDLASPLLGMASGAVKGYKESQGDVGHTAIKAVSGGFGGAGNTVRSYFAGPTINALLFNTAGKDSYTNNDIVKKDATDKQRMYLTAKYLVEQYAPLPTPLMRMYDMTEAMVKGEDERKRNAITVPRSPIENVIGLAGINVLRYDQKALDKQMKDFSAEAQDFTEIKQKLTKLDGMLKESKERKDIDTYNKIISKHQDEMRTLGDLKKTETQLRKLKSMRDEAMMSSDDKAVLELNKQINQIMKAFNERNKK